MKFCLTTMWAGRLPFSPSLTTTVHAKPHSATTLLAFTRWSTPLPLKNFLWHSLSLPIIATKYFSTPTATATAPLASFSNYPADYYSNRQWTQSSSSWVKRSFSPTASTAGHASLPGTPSLPTGTPASTRTGSTLWLVSANATSYNILMLVNAQRGSMSSVLPGVRMERLMRLLPRSSYCRSATRML